MDMLRINGLRKRFGDKTVLQDLDLTVPEGSIFGFVGKNGAGKTTTMKAVLGLLQPDAGEILVAGQPVRFGNTQTNAKIGYLPDVPEFYGFMTAREYLHFCGQISGMKTQEIRQRTQQLLEMVGLGEEKHRIRGFSRGMKQRLGIAQALLHRPKLLLCDEPTSALDPVGRKEMLELLQAVQKETTVLFSTHILSDVERICTDVAFLQDGKITLYGKMADIRSRYRSDLYLVELARADHTAALQQAFSGMQPSGDHQLTFAASQHDPNQVLQFIADQAMPLLRWEQQEPTLESLFLEVMDR